jgi:rod shape-determining protein MreD
MNLQKKKLWVVFLSSFFFTIWAPALFPQCRLFFFAPFIIILLYKKRFITCLWGALFCGLFIDLLSSYSHLGIHALNYTLTAGILYRQRRHFFADSPTTLPIMVYLFSLIATIIQLPLLYVFEQKLTISGEWIRTDLIFMPILDSFFAFILYILPFWIFGKQQLRGEDYFTQED